MTERRQDDVYRAGELAGRDVDKQVADCPYDHDGPEEMRRRRDWLAGFAAGRQDAAPAETAHDYEPRGPRENITPELPVYRPG